MYSNAQSTINVAIKFKILNYQTAIKIDLAGNQYKIHTTEESATSERESMRDNATKDTLTNCEKDRQNDGDMPDKWRGAKKQLNWSQTQGKLEDT